MNTQMFIEPEWPASQKVKAYTTLRTGGCSSPPYNDFNLAIDLDDKIEDVEKNRLILQQILQLPAEPIWIKQVHGNTVIPATPENRFKTADATFSKQTDNVCAVTTADCLPILLCDREATVVSAIHAGWRGLNNGIIKETLNAINIRNNNFLAWLGPAISQACFEVGEEVRSSFIQNDSDAEEAFIPSPNGRWLADLYALARLQLKKLGVTAIYGGEYCTFSNKSQFFSYRRDGAKTGRMASLIWISKACG